MAEGNPPDRSKRVPPPDTGPPSFMFGDDPPTKTSKSRSKFRSRVQPGRRLRTGRTAGARGFEREGSYPTRSARRPRRRERRRAGRAKTHREISPTWTRQPWSARSGRERRSGA